MIRPITCVGFVLACASGFYLYQTKHRVTVIDHEIADAVHQTGVIRKQIPILAAEWALLNAPDRIQQLVDQVLHAEADRSVAVRRLGRAGQPAAAHTVARRHACRGRRATFGATLRPVERRRRTERTRVDGDSPGAAGNAFRSRALPRRGHNRVAGAFTGGSDGREPAREPRYRGCPPCDRRFGGPTAARGRT